jgi:hypothetical protein
MKRKAASSQARRARLTGSGPSTSRAFKLNSSKEATGVRRTEGEMPLDAEDFVLASLEARVRAEEARVDLGSENLQAALTIRLPRPLLLQLRSQAAQRSVTLSRLIELALAQYLPQDSAGRRRR